MAAFVTTDDLISNALWLSGEPTDGSSDYNSQVLSWMQLIYDTLLNGGSLGTRDIATSAGLYEHFVDIPTTDWLWLRKFPPFAFVTTPAILGSGAFAAQSGPPPTVIGTVALTNGNATITFSTPPSVSVAGWRLILQNQAAGVITPPITVPRITAHIAGAATATLDTTWPQETQSASAFVLALLEYPLPTDFVRFCESPSVQGGWLGSIPPRLAIGSNEQVGDQYPLTVLAQGPPTAAARLTPSTIQMNRWDTQSYRIEFSYVFQPPALVANAAQEPLVPLRFRNVLCIGAAMMVTQDKVDGRTGALASEFREIVRHMGVEYRKEQNAGSELSGRHLYRRGQGRRGMLRTSSGLPLFALLCTLLLR